MNNLLKHIEEKWQFLKDKKLFIACSGGVDSMTLLHLFTKLSFDVEVLHVNYGLRGEDSEQDQLLVQKTCEKYNIPFHLKKLALATYLSEKGGNLQEEARKVRYDFFEEKRKLSENNYILLAHHLDDQVETFFLNLARNSGVMGLAAMKENHNHYIRPLLSYPKEVLIEYAKDNAIEWRDDASNKSNKYKRNALRNVFLPFLYQEINTLKESVFLMTLKFQETQLELEQKVTPIASEIFQKDSFSINRYKLLSSNEKIELLRQLQIKPALLSEIDKLANAEKGKFIKFEKPVLNEKCTMLYREANDFLFLIDKISPDYQLCIQEVKEIPKVFSPKIAYFDLAKIKGKLLLRKWKIGDRMHPIGMHGSKLISDILTDAKVPAHLKNQQLVVCDDRDVLWCVGYRISKKAIAAVDSEQIVKVEVKYENT